MLEKNGNRLIENIRKGGLAGTQAVCELFDTRPLSVAIRTLVKSTEQFSANDLGWTIFPGLRRHLRTNRDVFKNMLDLVNNTSLNAGFRIVLLDFLNDAARAKQEYDTFQLVLHKICADESQRAEVRSRAARYLVMDIKQSTFDMIRKFIQSRNIILIDSAAYIVLQWRKNRINFPDDLISLLIQFSVSSPSNALKSSSLLQALVQLAPAKACQNDAIVGIINVVSNDNDLAFFLGATGDSLEYSALIKLISTISKKPHPKSEVVLHSLLLSKPELIKRMYDAEHYREFLFICSLSPETLATFSLPLLLELSRTESHDIRGRTQKILQSLPVGSKVHENQLIRINNLTFTGDGLHNVLASENRE